MNVFAYALVLTGVPVFVGMFVGSFVTVPISRILQRSTNLQQTMQRTRVQLTEVINGFVAAIAGAFLFRLCELTPSLMILAMLALWISIYCLASHQHVPNWLSWLGGLVIGWIVSGVR
jgi:uncharacterized membrane protein AbrB (regulator of aidB expression)